MTAIEAQGAAAKATLRTLMMCPTATKDGVLLSIARALRDGKREILEANAIDMENARKSWMATAMFDRLSLDEGRIDAIADGVIEVAGLPDPIGQFEKFEKRPNGLIIGRKTVPLGVIAIVFEARPNVTVDAAVLCLKAGNAVILRGGKEALNSNMAFVKIMREAIQAEGLPADCVSIIQDTSHEGVGELLDMTEYIDALIPRGGAGLINYVTQNAKVPVIKTGVGNCHVYVEESADLIMAAKIVFNAKCRRVSVCNAAETLLVDASIAQKFLPMVKKLLDTQNTALRGCAKTVEILRGDTVLATEDDYYTEFLDNILAVKVVKGPDEAISHIDKYGSGHSEAIVTNNYAVSQRFLDEIDAAAVYVNASTAFTDGNQFGLGAEIGISTQKLHARGPMGLKELTSSKFIIYGNGQVRP